MARRVLAFGGVEHQSATVRCRAAASVSSITSSALNGAGGSTIRAKLLAADLCTIASDSRSAAIGPAS